MTATERGALLALLRLPGQSWSALADDVEAAGSALEVLHQGPAGQLSLFADEAGVVSQVAAAEEEIAGWERDGIRFLTMLNPDYPAQLLMVHQRPPFLTFRGCLDPADARSVAVVGTRQASERGLRAQRSWRAAWRRQGYLWSAGWLRASTRLHCARPWRRGAARSL